ncbi:MAG: hypothetical protein HZB13_14745 [Acidobacteria bacterium]|nr:hypothetical protein [Acidobacteriota bacterium]
MRKSGILFLLLTPALWAQVVLSVSVNGASDTRLSPGWSLIVEATLRAENANQRVTVAPSDWAQALTISIYAEDGTPAPVTLQWTAAPPASAELSSPAELNILLTLSPDTTQALAAGNYALQARLDASSSAAGAWTGSAESATAILTVAPPPEEPTPAELLAKLLLDARYTELTGDSAGAVAILNSWLEQQPDSIPALTLKAEILQAAGSLDEAVATVESAIRAVRNSAPAGSHPPRLLYLLRNEMLAQLLGQ